MALFSWPNWLDSLFADRFPSRPIRRKAPPCKSAIEPLEIRTLLSATQMVKDIAPGADFGFSFQGAYASPPVNVNGTLFFLASDIVHGQELWKSDGTAAGTVMVADLTPGEDSPGVGSGSDIRNMTAVGDTLFFYFDDGVHGAELWKSDGSGAGTVLVKDINLTGDGVVPTDRDILVSYGPPMVDVNGTLFFRANDGIHGQELWTSDGTQTGTVMVADFTPGEYAPGIPASSYFYRTTASGGVLYFAFDDGVHGLELWKSDGTAAGTVLVKDINPSGDSFNYDHAKMIDVNGTLYFAANDGEHGRELWKSDGTGAGTVMIADLVTEESQPGVPKNSYFYEFTVSDGQLFFVFDDQIHDSELWKSDGTQAGTVLVKDLNPGGDSINTAYSVYVGPRLVDVNGTLFLLADDGIHGQELWKSDGTAAGTVMVTDLTPGESAPGEPADTSLYKLTSADGLLYFIFEDSHDQELWKSDGTAAGTVLVEDIDPNGAGVYYDYANLTNVDGTLFFAANDGQHGLELWKLEPAEELTMADQGFDLPENSAVQTAVGTVVATDSDPNAVLTFNVLSQTIPGAFAVDSQTGQITIANAALVDFEANPTHQLTVQVTNDSAVQLTAHAVVTITLLDVNEAPSFVVGPDQSVSEDAAAQTIVDFITAISAGPGNEASQSLTFIVTNDHNGLFAVQPAITSNGTLTYTLAPNAVGAAQVSVTLQDGGGTANGGVDTSATQVFNITITAVDDPPEFTPEPPDPATFKIGSTPTAIDPNLAVGDPDNPVDFSNGQLTVDLGNTGSRADSLLFPKGSGRAAGDVFVKGKKLFFLGDQIGTISGGKKGLPLHVTFLDGVSQTVMNAVLQSLSFSTKGKKTPTGERSVHISIEDATGTQHAATTRTVVVQSA